MNKIIYTFTIVVTVATFVLTIIGGISLFASIIRSAIVFMGILLTFFIAGHLLRLGILLTDQKTKVSENDN
ncbi:MAG: hypothetical protein KAW56_02235 [Candidatus Marinimicrobia bacterium]|nr:hypothetical protein [Candidatus Neomarinimicrobiota bacterium]MCK4445880.1 hypothetical protein [Candidatus Neomarinimicrobiota bacterium]